jgi:glycosyltransferase 2 family protein
MAVALAAVTVALVDQWSAVSDSLRALSVLGIAWSFLAATLALLCTAQVWRVLLADLGSPLPARPSAQIYFASQLGKFIPGAVWPVLFRLELAADYGVPRRRSGLATMVQLAVVCATAAAVGSVALLFLPDVRDRHAWWLVPLAVVSVIAIIPAVLNRIVSGVARMLRRRSDDLAVSGGAVWRAAGWALAAWLGYGAHVAALAADLGAEGSDLWLASIGSYALAWLGGFLVFVAPSGAGVREGLLVLALGSVLAPGDALVVALVSRLVVTVIDAVAGVAAVTSARRARLRSRFET